MKILISIIIILQTAIIVYIVNKNKFIKSENERLEMNLNAVKSNGEANHKLVEILTNDEIKSQENELLKGKTTDKIKAKQVESITQMKIKRNVNQNISPDKKTVSNFINQNHKLNYTYKTDCQEIKIEKDTINKTINLSIKDSIPLQTTIYWKRKNKLLFGLIKYGSKIYEIDAKTDCQDIKIKINRVVILKKS